MVTRIILIGPPGVGKGTQSAMLERDLGARQLSSGNIFRTEIEAETDLGRLAKQYIARGDLVPNGVTIEMMAKRISSPTIMQSGFILDGYPRNLRQAEALDQELVALGIELDGVFSIEVDPEVVIERLAGRMGCTKCGAIYHQANRPPLRDWICDSCNSPLLVRDDDKPETIRERLRIFAESTKPVIDHYEAMGKVRRINGAEPPDEVYAKLRGFLGR